jgi:hypothetical protein
MLGFTWDLKLATASPSEKAGLGFGISAASAALGNEKILSGVWILHLSAAGEGTDINIAGFWGVRTGHKAWPVWEGNPKRQIRQGLLAWRDADR